VTVTAKDLRFNASMLFDVVSKGESVLITYRGKAKAKLVPCDIPDNGSKDDDMFGMWSDREEPVDEMMRNLRKGRNFGI